MKCFNLYVIFTVLFLKVCYTLNCEEAKNILNMEWTGDCCELQQFTCDDSGDNILSIDILSLQEMEKEDDESDVGDLFARSPKSRKIVKKGKKKVKSHYHNDDCYVSKQTMTECLATCDTKQDQNEKTTCQNTCHTTLKDSEDCRNKCEEINNITGKCLKFKDDESAANSIKMDSFLWIVAISLLLKVLY